MPTIHEGIVFHFLSSIHFIGIIIIITCKLQVKEEEMERLESFWAANRYVAGAYDSRRDFELLNQELNAAQLPGERQLSMLNANRLFYLALPPSVFEVVTANIRHACMATKYKLSPAYFLSRLPFLIL